VYGNITAHIKAIYHQKTFIQTTSNLPQDAVFGLILDRTSFYAEAGGQEYDTGNIVIDGIADFDVTDVQVFSGYVLHIGHLKYGELEVGNEVISCYDEVIPIYLAPIALIRPASFDDGHCATTTPLHIFSIFVSVKCSATM
jgi:alanyl-tRNA synthetase